MFSHYCSPAGNAGHPEQGLGDQWEGRRCCPKSSIQGRVLCDAKAASVSLQVLYIFLTIKQTTRLAEHCRENDITAEF